MSHIGGASLDGEKVAPKNYPIAKINENSTAQKKGWILIPIKQVLYDAGMRNKIKEICNEKGKGTKGLRGGFNLHKWDKVWDEIKTERPLDPIIVKKYKNTEYYEVKNGRHRATASLCSGFESVPAFVI